jgi:hypothetical protein
MRTGIEDDGGDRRMRTGIEDDGGHRRMRTGIEDDGGDRRMRTGIAESVYANGVQVIFLCVFLGSYPWIHHPSLIFRTRLLILLFAIIIMFLYVQCVLRS